jgi:pimeloyl-ACP methyl ester carboxylesterase
MFPMRKLTSPRPATAAPARVRRGYFESRYGQLHVHHAMPPGGGFEEGVPLVCVHDFVGSGRAFTGFLALAGTDRSVYAPDLPGFGESDAPEHTPAIADYAAALGDFLDTMRLRSVVLVGLRLGALVATELALARVPQVSRLIFLSLPLLTEAEREMLRPPGAAASDGDGLMRPAQWQRWAFEAAAQYPLRERLGKLRQRALALRLRDEYWDATARSREALPGIKVLEFEQAAAELLGAAPQRLMDGVREFLNG